MQRKVENGILQLPDGIRINRTIPRTMTMAGLHYLGRLARSVPEGGVILELGPLYGSSTWVLSQNSHPTVTVYSVDTWASQEWIARRLPDAPPFGIDAFRHFVSDCPNVEPIQGMSPQVLEGWSREIDMFFDDATHGDPGFSANVNFALPFVKSGGILCGDDYASGWPDIIRVVDSLAAERGVRPEVCGRVWAITKEAAPGVPSAPVSARIGPWSRGDVVVRVRTQSGEEYTGEPRMWAGAIRRPDPVTGIAIAPREGAEVDGHLTVRLADGSERPGLAFGVFHTFDVPVVNVAIELAPDFARRHTISYQCCEMMPGKSRTMNSKASRDGDFLQKGDGTTISALRVEVD